jgi:predicted O-linked N-acetylglucosamine transferase (SPINDLY family)
LGVLLADTRDVRGAIDALTIAVGLDAGYARAWNNLGNALRAGGRLAEALEAVRRAVAVQPDYALAWANLGTLLLDLGDDGAARDAFRRALALKPDLRVVQALAGIARQRGDIDDAVDLFTRVIAAAPEDTNAMLQLAGALAERDDLDAARRVYAGARTRRPGLLRAAFGEALTLPMVYPDAAAVASARARYDEGLARLEAEVPTLVHGRTFADVIDDLRWTNFGRLSGKTIATASRFATLMARAIDGVAPEWRASPRASATGARIRIGFASSFFSDGTCGRYFRSWIADLDRTRSRSSSTTCAATPHLPAAAVGACRPRADVSGTALVPSAIAPAIRADALDVLVYPELGMNAPTFVLAALRLAPIQCAAWGHPVTSGHATIDAFFTCAAMEPGDAAQHYAEKLVPLPGIGTNYERPAVPDGASRERFGLPEGVPLFLCPQSLFKIHPDTDALFARVLTAVPTARLVAFEGRHPALTAKYRARLAGAFGRAGLRDGDRLILLPQCGHDDYLRINAVCVRCSTRCAGPAATRASMRSPPACRSRCRALHAQAAERGMLSIAGLDDLIARDDDDYVRIASTLASNRAFQREVSARTRDAAAKLSAIRPRARVEDAPVSCASVRRDRQSALPRRRAPRRPSRRDEAGEKKACGRIPGAVSAKGCQRQSAPEVSRIHVGRARAPQDARCSCRR